MEESELVKFYEDGKDRRYKLLFAVNGGAFAIAKIMVDASHPNQALGKLSLTELSVGMAIFTAVMTYDIYCFGQKMRKQLQALRCEKHVGMFSREGKTVLLLIGLLIVLGWIRAGWQ
jgi:hypothetical protein